MQTRLSCEEIQGDVLRKVAEISGENVFACYQCGKCSAGCPSAGEMELLPNQVLQLLQMGKVDLVLKSNTPWVCAACFTCSVRCPKGVDLARVMEAVRQIVLRTNVDRTDPRKVEGRDKLPQIALISNFRKHTA